MKRLAGLISTLAMAVALQVSPAFAQDSGNLDQYSGSANGNQAGEQVTLTGTIEKPEATAYQYGTHSVSDDDSGYYALQSEMVDLDTYVGQSVTIYGTLVPGYENGQIEGGPPLVEVTKVESVEKPGDYRVTLGFELAVEGQPPAGTTFFGYVPAEGGISTQLTDLDGDGLYAGSMDVPQYAPGPRPVPEGIDPVTLPVQIVSTTETRDGFPLNPAIIKDFGDILMDEDKTFSASIVFEGPGKPVEPGQPNPDPTTPEPTTSEPTDPGSSDGGSSGSSSGKDVDSEGSLGSNDRPGMLPDTGGVTLTILGIVALLGVGGLLFAGLLSTGVLRRR